MANITINNTDKAGYLHISLNDYFNGTNGDVEFYSPISTGIGGIIVGKMDGNDYIALHLEHENISFYLTNAGTFPNILIVDSINGIAPSSFADLKTKLLALL
jgi:hypothetical protein